MNSNINEPTIKKDVGSLNGQNKCPKCGSTDISLNVKAGNLRCNFCRYEYSENKLDETDLNNLEGEIVSSGASEIKDEKASESLITLKCSSCGSQVVIDANLEVQARCHWCRNILSINDTVPNGMVPDALLPFSLTKNDAQKLIESYVSKRKFFANSKFKKEFTTQNIMGVYFPYIMVDLNAHSLLKGEGEIETRSYTVEVNDHQERYYDADVYNVSREFDIIIDGLTIESSKDRLDKNNNSKTNNVINAIMPFDTKNCVKFNANYMRGYTSEKRDINIDDLKETVLIQAKDIAKFAVNKTVEKYDRGVRWEKQDLNVKGIQYKAVYLPVWLYSYQEVRGNKKILHYVAVNARSKETVGSVPIHYPKLIAISSIIEIISFFICVWANEDYIWILMLSGVIYFLIIYGKYRNKDARHNYETETDNETSNVVCHDSYLTSRKRMTNPKITGANNFSVSETSSSLLKDLQKQISDEIKFK